MSDNNNLPIKDKVIITNYIKSILEPYAQNLNDLRDKIIKLFSVISDSEEVSLYVHSEVLKCERNVIGYNSTLILYYRMNNFWNTIPSHIVCDDRDTCMQEVIKQFLTRIPEEDRL
jgi:hypothetical protein